MPRSDGIQNLLLACVALVSWPALAQSQAAGAPAAPPNQVEQKRQQLLEAFSGSRAAGQCEAVRELRAWQESAWVDGKSALDRYFVDVVLAFWMPQAEREAPDAAQRFAPKYAGMCSEIQARYDRLMQELAPAAGAAPLPAEAVASRKELADAFANARFFGECSTYSQWLQWLQQNQPADLERTVKFLESGYFVRMGYAKSKFPDMKFEQACELAGVSFSGHVSTLQQKP